MTERMIENRVKKLKESEKQQKALEAAVDAIRAELKADLEEKGIEELKTKSFMIRWKEIVSSRLDGKALKAALPVHSPQKVNFDFLKRGFLYENNTVKGHA